MFWRLLLALPVSPFLGAVAFVCSLPTAIAWALLIGALGMVAGAAVIVMPVLGIIGVLVLVMLADIALMVQIARFAGSFTGLARFDKQPTLGLALKRGVAATIIFKLLLFLVTFAVSLLLIKYGVSDEDGWNPRWIAQTLARDFTDPIVQNGVIVMENETLVTMMLAIRVVGIIFLSLLAIVMVPRSLGLGWEYDGTWTVSFILFRLFVVTPVLAFMVGVLTILIVLGFDALVVTSMPELRPTAQALYAIEYCLYLGAVFVMEALILKAGFAVDQAGEREVAALSIRSPEEYRALRESRTDPL